MPDQYTSHSAAIRADGHVIRCFASFIAGATVAASGTLTATPSSPYNTVSVTFGVGAYTDVLSGMEIVFYNAAGTGFKGRSHIRYGGTIGAASLPIREYSKAKLNLVSGDRFIVYKDWRLHDKLVAADETFAPDLLTFSDEGANPPPLACSGGHWAGKVDSGLTYATVLITGTGSALVDPDSSTPVTYLTTLPTGVTFAPGSANTDASPTLRVTVGEYVITRAVTDPDNSKTTTQHLQLKCTDDDHPPHEILFTPDTATADSGFGGAVEIVSGATTQAVIPDGTLAILWADERIGGSWVSYRNAAPGRAHILCVGYVRRDTQSGEEDGSRRVSFEIISPLARMKEITSYSKVMIESASPDAWDKIKTLGVKRAITQIVQFYSTMQEAGFDLTYDSAFLDYRYPALYLQRATFFDQIMELARGVDAQLACDRAGRFDVHTDPRLIALADRAAVTKTWRFAQDDVLTYSFPREHVDTVEQYKVSGVSGGTSNNNPFFSLYPGASPGEGIETPSQEHLILDGTRPQDDLNERAGRYGANADKIYSDANGLRYRAFPLTLTLRGAYDFFDFSKEYADFSETLPSLARDVDLTAFKFALASTSTGYDENGTAATTVVFDVVPNAEAGETHIPLASTMPEISVPAPPPITTTPSRIPPPSGRQPTRALLFSTHAAEAKCALVTDFNTWAAVDRSTGLTAGEPAIAFTDDAWNYARVLKVDATNLQVCSNIETGASWSTIATIASLLTVGAYPQRIITDHKRSGYFAICSGSNVFIYSTDNGITWSAPISINGLALDYTFGGDSRRLCDIGVFPHTAGALWAVAVDSSDTNNGALYISTTYGASWTRVNGLGALSFQGRFHIQSPYKRNGGTANTGDSSMEVILGASGYVASGSKNYVFLSSNKGVSFSTAFTGADAEGGLSARVPVNAWTHDAVYGWSTDGSGVVNTDDHWSSSSTVLTGLSGYGVDIQLWPPDRQCAIVTDSAASGQAHITTDFGAAWSSGLPSGFSGGVIGELSLYTVQ